MAFFASSALVAGWSLERLQALLLEVRGPVSKVEHAQLIEATKITALQINRDTAGGGDETFMIISQTSRQSRPPTRATAPNSNDWDMEAYAEAISDGKRTWLPLTDIPSSPEQAKTSTAPEIHRRISVDSRETNADDLQTRVLWHNIKQERLAKDREAMKTGRRVRRKNIA
ncbi:MAG: hypothetical protein M1835_002917 [Candelina submexicana]|nr:MAG: hypothetical protein M1835_002917 [Candelina submexicana]